MERKYIKLFEEKLFITPKDIEIFDSVYESWRQSEGASWMKLYEQADYFDEETAMTAGEERAFSRGLQIMSKSQMAALYLFALGKEEEVGADYLKMIDGLEPFGYYDEVDQSYFNITVPALADAIGMSSDRTLSRTVNKFRKLISGEGETHSEVLYDKVIKAFEAFSRMQPSQIAVYAADAIQDPATSTSNRDKAEQRNVKSAERRQQKKLEDKKIGESIFNLVKGLLGAGLGIERALPMAISKVSKEAGVESAKLKGIYQKFLADNGVGRGYI